MIWTRNPADWKYRATDAQGTRWHIVQRTSSAWTIYEDGRQWLEAHTLADAKAWVEDEVRERLDPQLRAKRNAARAARRARREARAV